MKKKDCLVVIIATLLIGFILGRKIEQNQQIKPEEALKEVRESLKRNNEVSGSWIYMKPEWLHKNDLEYKVYHGGITKKIDGENVPYEFYLDAITGTIIDMHPSRSTTLS